MSDRRPKIRCAVYTRKSSDEGLDQAFNSLDAQHEAAAAYVASQKHEGWVLVRDRYDDGGISGGTLERPGLQKLLSDIASGLIDMVVVYKIDRLTRSLADFAKLVHLFDRHKCSFVSVTQAFNTSTSMGRLTLNVLLSFAQFEREVTAERIRDKIAASKRKGLWMGGLVPLGYERHPDPQQRSLVINQDEARTVRRVFDLYHDLGDVMKVVEKARLEGLRTKRHTLSDGRIRGGHLLTRGQVYYLLRNPIYIGNIRHKDDVHEGQHPPIIDTQTWDNVQNLLQSQAKRPRKLGAKTSATSASNHTFSTPNAMQSGETSPFAGKLFDETGDRLTPSHSNKKGKRHRYCVSRRLIRRETNQHANAEGSSEQLSALSATSPEKQIDHQKKSRSVGRGWRLEARQLEQTITKATIIHLREVIDGHRLLQVPDADLAISMKSQSENLLTQLVGGGIGDLAELISRCVVQPGMLQIEIDAEILAEKLSIDQGHLAIDCLSLSLPFQIRRRGVEARIVSGIQIPQPDIKLIELLRKAHHWLARIKKGDQLVDIARDGNHAENHVRSRIKLAFLSPRIQSAILSGTQPTEVTLESLVSKRLPLDWKEQEKLLGF